MRINVDMAICSGHARCNVVAPHVYDVDENGYSQAGGKPVPAGLEAQAQRGARACPERAITLINDDDTPLTPM